MVVSAGAFVQRYGYNGGWGEGLRQRRTLDHRAMAMNSVLTGRPSHPRHPLRMHVTSIHRPRYEFCKKRWLMLAEAVQTRPSCRFRLPPGSAGPCRRAEAESLRVVPKLVPRNRVVRGIPEAVGRDSGLKSRSRHYDLSYAEVSLRKTATADPQLRSGGDAPTVRCNGSYRQLGCSHSAARTGQELPRAAYSFQATQRSSSAHRKYA